MLSAKALADPTISAAVDADPEPPRDRHRGPVGELPAERIAEPAGSDGRRSQLSDVAIPEVAAE